MFRRAAGAAAAIGAAPAAPLSAANEGIGGGA
jgi:hypothetical protein